MAKLKKSELIPKSKLGIDDGENYIENLVIKHNNIRIYSYSM